MQRLVLESLLKQSWEAGNLSKVPVGFFTDTLLPAALTPGTIKGEPQLLLACSFFSLYRLIFISKI